MRWYWAILVLFVLVMLNLAGVFAPLNQPLSHVITSAPGVSCSSAADCAMRPTSCDVCDCGVPANKDYKPFCPFFQGLGSFVQCKRCLFAGTPACVNATCMLELSP
ncbi:hypothetical protein AUJ68_06880 [Candidatus Woesearchaeota archaeon CG1_02_57_44]|nr:MAG: hypothetical protein AUJ68_06880 [Candidatus Woesearchaeota archaeon CG1_02_57_44]